MKGDLLLADGAGIDIRIGSVIQHPSWNPTTLVNDICILKLTQTVQYTT
jgi:Trypsin